MKNNSNSTKRPKGFTGFHFIPGNLRQQREGRRGLFRGIQTEIVQIRERLGRVPLSDAKINSVRRLLLLENLLPECEQFARSENSDIRKFGQTKEAEYRAEIEALQREILPLNSNDVNQLKLALSREYEIAQYAHELAMDYSDSRLTDQVTDKLIEALHPVLQVWIYDIIFDPRNYEQNWSPSS